MTPVRHRVLPLVFMTAFVAACSQPQPEPAGPSSEQMMSAASALDTSFAEAFNRGDVDALASMYANSPDVVVFAPDAPQPAVGIDAVRSAMTAMMAGMSGAKIEITESHQVPTGDVVLGYGLFTLTLPDGNQIMGRYTDVKAERDGKWVYLSDHASVPLPPPPAAPATN